MDIKKIAVLCSGGDGPGMNAAIRSIVRTAIGHDIEVFGIQKGYAGLLEGNFRPLDVSSVGNILQHGGTILQTSRCLDFHRPEVRAEAANLLKRKKIDALIVIGGDGSFNGAMSLHKEHGISVIGIPGTIDNDISNTEYTIGFDTAVKNAVDAVDKIRDTASSHERTFIVEVMGKKSSAIAYTVGVCTGAENVLLADAEDNYSQVASDIKRGVERGKTSSIIIVGEAEKPGLSYRVQQILQDEHQLPAHVCVLGHVQRGGSPTPLDRLMASEMGHLAVTGLLQGSTHHATVVQQGRVILTELENCLIKKNDVDPWLQELVKALSI
jgi:6-phosphofructokinase 1